VRTQDFPFPPQGREVSSAIGSAQRDSKYTDIRLRIAASGRGPEAAPRCPRRASDCACRNGAGHRGMPEDPFQEELRPARAADLLGPRGQRLVADASEHRPFREGPVDDHRGTGVAAAASRRPSASGSASE